MLIRAANLSDADAIWTILQPIIRAGETYALPRDWSRDDAVAYWLAPGHAVFVAGDQNGVVGTYFMQANQSGGGDHVANCGYMVRSDAGGRGVARTMCEHSLAQAVLAGFTAMHFNFVVSTNHRAVALWRRLGFEIVGTLPGAFRHPIQRLVDALVLFRAL